MLNFVARKSPDVAGADCLLDLIHSIRSIWPMCMYVIDYLFQRMALGLKEMMVACPGTDVTFMLNMEAVFRHQVVWSQRFPIEPVQFLVGTLHNRPHLHGISTPTASEEHGDRGPILSFLLLSRRDGRACSCGMSHLSGVRIEFTGCSRKNALNL
ncbi:hypothetical protein BO86DRAFT_139697 [Aspergillus japonicus CBS 114.51]|uniref:Uncharacterized protein n=1 Tax=Aspergillus japonicus CBS 114.51 TaxID=1448312 RepID=A0A8T8XCW6_ASPJA|nr:hypothetical protein BO86DRAFT_139697 [Aspergillus japonicus CBS 114.51]RAH86123.1 hypothetical protein BO86DRAFT_139697 [Aspergillus japonicus CBS 114.51]